MENASYGTKRPYSDTSYGESADKRSRLYSSRAAARAFTARRTPIRNLAFLTGAHNLRELWDWATCDRVSVPSVPQISSVLAALECSPQTNFTDAAEAPIFLLATGWRSGSTLLQRILVTDPTLLLWGEPLGEMGFVSSIVDTLMRLATFPDLEDKRSHTNGVFSSLATSWIATLYPPGQNLRSGLAMLFNGWLGEPARNRGYARWGFKETRLSATEAVLLHWLYPKAKFLLLSRDPYDCYRSLADSGWHHLYYQRPYYRVDSAAGLARHWNRLATSWSELPVDFPCFRVKYEDLVDRKVNFRELETWLGVRLNEEIALQAFVGSTARRKRLGLVESAIISHETAAGRRALGYLH